MEEKVGELAGYVWRYLEEVGEASPSQITKDVDAAQTKVYMAMGWLAREDKIVFNTEGRGSKVRLK